MQTEKVKAGIRQCLMRLEPAIFAYKRPPNIETALAFLEDMDEGAGGCDAFRGWLMTSLEASVRAMVRAEVQHQCRYARLFTIFYPPASDVIKGFAPLCPTFTPSAQLLRSFLLAQKFGARRKR